MAFLKPTPKALRTLVPAPLAQTVEADAPRYTREAEEQDAYGKARRARRVWLDPEDYATTGGGFLTEAVKAVALQGWAEPTPGQDTAALLDAARSWRKPWAQEEGPALPAD